MEEFQRVARILVPWWILSAVIVTVDQATKLAIVSVMTEGGFRPIEVLPFLNWVMAWNRGMSFGLFSQGGNLAPWGFLVVAVVFSGLLSIWLVRAHGLLMRVALAAMIGGALGNAIDRVRWGAVADFVDVHFLGWHFWAFNVADAMITIGAVLLIADGLFRRQS